MMARLLLLLIVLNSEYEFPGRDHCFDAQGVDISKTHELESRSSKFIGSEF